MSKLLSLNEAIALYVSDGDTVYAAGFTHLIPFAAGHEIIRQGKRDLTLARATPDLSYDHRRLEQRGATEVRIEIPYGLPGQEIVRHAREHNYNLIVMSTRGLTGLKHVVLGSVAERTLRLAPCPVLTLKAT